MTNEELELRFARLVKTERKITVEVLRLICEAEQREHYLGLGFGGLLDWLSRGHGYSHPAAQRRVQAARLFQIMPEVGSDIEDGLLSVSVLALISGILRAQADPDLSLFAKRELVQSLKGISYSEAEKILRARFPLAAKKELLRSVNGQESRLAINLSEESLRNLHRAREILSHVVPSGRWSEVVGYLAKDFIKRKDPIKKKKSDAAAQDVNLTKSATCNFRDPATGRVCGSRYQLQEDHIIPRALGGPDTPENKRLLCRKHNIYEAERLLGAATMAPFRRH